MQTIKVEGMTCGHCVRAVTDAVRTIDPGAKIDVNLGAGSVITDSEAQLDKLADAIRSAGYSVAATSPAHSMQA